ncbi:phosphoserine phosphatase SerB [Chelativorans sp. ZYF759]|uniref:phosphoserine phosphatase SerB n=1 Tax=Chelativorans sp. ZYF759 TaxID=2692213 RepID=UPI00145E684D|nr:phosphoserine phosphatase SerB [Chelativorans sp. ZYF759]NMG41353.1 phosphoserine phosphatase SerB [Chelativorans sp. ZYF759]
MPLVATLISSQAQRALSQPLADKAARAIGATRHDWLAPEIACDLPVPGGMAKGEALAALNAALDGAPVDCVVQAADDRRRAILIADMDSTMIDQECIDELADMAGLKEHVAAITARAMNGEIEFEGALRERVALLAGLEAAVIDQVIAERITLAAGGRELVATMNAAGAFTLLVSGGFTTFTTRIAAMLGFREHQANVLIEAEGRLAGTVAEPILGRAAKAQALRAVSARLGLSPGDAIAVGDGANDLDMVQLAGTGVALHAKPSVASAAPHRIDHGDLTALLYMQGYRRDEFVA